MVATSAYGIRPPPTRMGSSYPDEGVNADLKQAVPRRAPARSQQQLKWATINHMRSLSKQPKRIRAIFRHRRFRYAA